MGAKEIINEGQQSLILVDEQDLQTGIGAKLDVHERGLRHRAFSIFAFNSSGELLLQRRDQGKYHSGGLWANTCCGHPGPDESTRDAAHRRLTEELNIETALTYVRTISYRAPVGSGLIENEIAHCYAGRIERPPPSPNPSEVSETRFVGVEALLDEISESPEQFAAWLRIYLANYPELLRSAMATIRSGPPGATVSNG